MQHIRPQATLPRLVPRLEETVAMVARIAAPTMDTVTAQRRVIK